MYRAYRHAVLCAENDAKSTVAWSSCLVSSRAGLVQAPGGDQWTSDQSRLQTRVYVQRAELHSTERDLLASTVMGSGLKRSLVISAIQRSVRLAPGIVLALFAGECV